VRLLDAISCSAADVYPYSPVEGRPSQLCEQGGGPFARQLNLFAPPYGSPVAWRNPTRPAVSTADYYHLDGLHWFRPYDLQNEFGQTGKAIAAATGYRYVCFLSPDHADSDAGRGQRGWGRDAASIYVGFTNDPAILPSPLTLRPAIPYSMTLPKIGLYVGFQDPWLVYNPEDPTLPFYLYAEGHEKVGETRTGREDELLFRSSDLFTWTFSGISHATIAVRGCTAYQSVYRVGPGNWISYGGAQLGLNNKWEVGIWTSSDAQTFTLVRKVISTLDNREFWLNSAAQQVSIKGKVYAVCCEDARNADGGMYVSLAPLDANGNLARDQNGVVRISGRYQGLYPGPTYLACVSGYAEDGIYHAWASHGFFSDNGLIWGARYEHGGGLDEQYLDYYSFVYDEGLAAQAAPVGLRASCNCGVVALDWHNALPTSAYRVYRGPSKTGPWTCQVDAGGGRFTDAAPTLGETSFYKIVTLEELAERASRVVRVYASEASALVNAHVDRALEDGADPKTIDVEWLSSVDAWLSSNGLSGNLMFWTDPAFGCKLDGHAVLKIYDLGTTRLPRGGDLTPSTSDTVYVGAGLNGTAPTFFNLTHGAMCYYGSGRLNNIRRKSQITVVAAYQKTNINPTVILSFGDVFCLQQTSGSPGFTSFTIAGIGPRLSNPLRYRPAYDFVLRLAGVSNGYNVTATKKLPPGNFQIVAGTFDGRIVTSFAGGEAGASQIGVLDNSVLLGQVGDPPETFVLRVGSQSSEFSSDHFFDNSATQLSASDLIIFDTAISSMQIASLTTLLTKRIQGTNRDHSLQLPTTLRIAVNQ
jgi:hypothetical protein